MATLTSTKAGVWSDPTVWGGSVPTTGDDVVINHDIEYDLNDYDTCLNLITINSSGALRHKEGVQTAIYVWQVMIYGTYQMGPLSKHKIHRKGTDTYTTTGRIYLSTTNYSKLLLQGSRLDIFTNLTASPSIGSACLNVADSSKIGFGDFIHVYKDNRSMTDDHDEGFWVNYVESGKVWVRRFVGPSVTTTAQANAGTSEIYVDNARKFFEASKAIAHNSNTVIDIQSVDLATNKIILASPLSTTISAGTVLYETGTEKIHDSDSEVRVNCMTLQSAISANTTNVIQLSNAGRLSVGDTLYIEDTHYSGTARYEGTFATVSAINGNSVTLSNMYRRNYQTVTNLTNFDRNIENGAIVVRLVYDCIVEADESPGPYIDVADTSSNNNRQVMIENVLLNNLGGSSSTTYRGLSLRGYFNGTAGGTCIVQRNALLSCNRKTDGEGIYFYVAYYGVRPVRCNFIWGAYSGLRFYGCFQGGRIFGNISSFAGYHSFRVAYILHGMKFAYNLGTASQNYAFLFESAYYERPRNMRSDGWEVYADSNISRFAVFPFYMTETTGGLRYSMNRFSFYKPYYTPNYPIYYNGFLYILNSEIVNQITTTTYDNSHEYNHFGMTVSVNNGIVFLNQNFNGETVLYTGRAIFYLDIDGGKSLWRMRKRNTGYWSGLVGSCYLTKGSRAIFTGQIKVASDYNGSTPRVRWYSPFNLPMQSQDIANYAKGLWLPYIVEVTAEKSGFYFFSIESNADDKDVWMTNPTLYIDGYEMRQGILNFTNQAHLKERVVFDREITPSDAHGIRLMGAKFGG